MFELTRRWAMTAAFLYLLNGTAGRSEAGIVFYTDRAAFLAASGPASFSEDFSSFLVDTPFTTSPVSLSGMTISQEGDQQTFRNFIDVAPLEFFDNNGTNNASLFTNKPEVGTLGTQVRITFNSLNSAFGGESWGANSGEGVILEVYDSSNLLGSQALTGGSGDFLGYVLTNGDIATSVLYRSDRLLTGGGGEGFGLDNLVGVNSSVVPEPSSLALSGISGLIGLGLARHRRNRVSLA